MMRVYDLKADFCTRLDNEREADREDNLSEKHNLLSRRVTASSCYASVNIELSSESY